MTDIKRRDFLKTVSAAAAVPTLLKTGALAAISGSPSIPVPLPDIPTCDSMRSVVMTHKFGDLYAWPGLTNQWGCAQAAMDVVAVRSIAFPPYAQGEMNVAPLGSGGELLTGVLYVDGEYFASTKTPIEFVWQPDKIERKTRYKDLEITSTTIVPFKTMSVAVKFIVKNTSSQRRKTEIKLAINGGASKAVEAWGPSSPGEFDNARTIDSGRNAVLCKSVRTDAVVLQGSSPTPDQIFPSWLIYNFDLAPNESRSVTFVNSLGETAADAQRDFDTVINSFDSVAKSTYDEWNAELKAAFTPNNGRYSGYLPTLVTDDEPLKRLYHTAVMSAIYFRRTTPHSVYGTTYVTLM
ncbi:MAG: hypothetical protein ACRD43_02450, partial [Pyrinomonadaceae bacterium]